MSLLLIDAGNTRLKWARLTEGRMDSHHAAAVADWDSSQFAARLIGRRIPARIVVSSVAGPQIGRRLVAAARLCGAPAPQFVRSQRAAAGITTQYREPWRLGVDRFVAVIGAHHLAAGEPAMVASIGTAATIDLVDGRGRHRGGAILPGPKLMVNSLLQQTHGIRRRAQGRAAGSGGDLFARSTREAIEQGALYAVAAAIDRGVEDALAELGRKPLVLLTGGAAGAIKALLRNSCVSIPDLVLHGLAVWAHHVGPV